ncbi:MAG: hypothetical protein QOF76_3857 [Solirubrobacteraceae bacterium]|jgi:uncharacterized circularly permuted ATP-grasp superfamily protein|nr:hypothetical protein [Solirubrobacteraceae bacterium]
MAMMLDTPVAASEVTDPALLTGDLPAQAEDLRAADAAREVPLGFPIDPLPRVIAAGEWETVSAGLCQRTRALDAFVADIYGRQTIVREGVVPAAAVASARYFEPLMQQAAHDERRFITVAGFDVVRGSDGRFRVFGDAVRTPTGVAYAIAVREAVARRLPARGVAPLAPSIACMRRALQAAAPAGVTDPMMALLTDGPGSPDYADHRPLAKLLGIPLVRLHDLRRRADALCARIGGREVKLDVVYRRTEEDRLSHSRGGLTDVAKLLLEPWSRGTLGLVNAFGTGVADDRLLHAYVEEMIGYYLGEDPLLESVESWDLFAPGVLNRALEQLDRLVVKPRSGPGVMVGPTATESELERAAHCLRTAPSQYVVQRYEPRSVHAAVYDGEVVDRPVDLRAFVFYGERDAVALPGGVTRVSGGSAKDTWIR